MLDVLKASVSDPKTFIICGCEAGLDLKYLSDRYQKGKAAVENMMNKCHRFTHQSSIIMAHNAIVSMQNELGTNGWLSKKLFTRLSLDDV